MGAASPIGYGDEERDIIREAQDFDSFLGLLLIRAGIVFFSFVFVVVGLIARLRHHPNPHRRP